MLFFSSINVGDIQLANNKTGCHTSLKELMRALYSYVILIIPANSQRLHRLYLS